MCSHSSTEAPAQDPRARLSELLKCKGIDAELQLASWPCMAAGCKSKLIECTAPCIDYTWLTFIHTHTIISSTKSQVQQRCRMSQHH